MKNQPKNKIQRKGKSSTNTLIIIMAVILLLAVSSGLLTFYWQPVSTFAKTTYNSIVNKIQGVSDEPIIDKPIDKPIEKPTPEEPTPEEPTPEEPTPEEPTPEEPTNLVVDGKNLFNSASGKYNDDINKDYYQYFFYEPIEILPNTNYYISCHNIWDVYGERAENAELYNSNFDLQIILSKYNDWNENCDNYVGQYYYYEEGADYFRYSVVQQDTRINFVNKDNNYDYPIEWGILGSDDDIPIGYKYLFVAWKYYDDTSLNNLKLKIEKGIYPTSYTEYNIGLEILPADGVNLFDVSTGFALDTYCYFYSPIEICEGNAYSISIFNDITNSRIVGDGIGAKYDFDVDIYLTYDDEFWWDEQGNYTYDGERKIISPSYDYLYVDAYDPKDFSFQFMLYNFCDYKFIHIVYRFGEPITGVGLNNALIKIEVGTEPTPWTPYGEGASQ